MGEHSSWIQRFSHNRKLLDAAQKPSGGVPAYTRWINRRGARIVAAAAAASGIGPNGVTFLSLLLSVSGMIALVLLPDAAWAGLPVAFLLAAGYLFDSADGQLARLTGTSTKAGEWLDHVVDAFRTPAIHCALALALVLNRPTLWWVAILAIVHSLVVSGQFLSQILAEALIRRRGGTQRRGGTLRSFVLLPTDPGTLCWSFAVWGFPRVFAVVYSLLTLVAVAHSAVSLMRRYADLCALEENLGEEREKNA